jgi:predicted metal-dependent hydrolase
MLFDWTIGELAEGLRCYHGEQFWHAHEHWESVWLELDGQEKTFLQALIQVTAAFHHWQRKNPIGTASLLRNALRRLDPLPANFCGIAVDPLRQSLHTWLDALEGREGAPLPFPRIR